MKFAFKSILLIMSCITQSEFIMLNNIAIEASRIRCMMEQLKFTQGFTHANYEKSFNSLFITLMTSFSWPAEKHLCILHPVKSHLQVPFTRINCEQQRLETSIMLWCLNTSIMLAFSATNPLQKTFE